MQVLYAVSSTEYYQQMAAYSLQSLRSVGSKIPARIRVFGKAHRCLRATVEADAWTALLPGEAVHPRMGPVLKWVAVAQEDSRRVLFVDADTCFMESPETVFARFRDADLYADAERGTTGDWRRGNKIIKKRIDDKEMGKLLTRFESRERFVPFSGVMLFNRSAHRTLTAELPLFLKLYTDFLGRRLPYPCSLPYMADEVAAGIILGRLRSGRGKLLKIAHFDSGAITHFNDWLPDPGGLGSILHLGNQMAPRGYRFLGWEREGDRLAWLREKMAG